MSRYHLQHQQCLRTSISPTMAPLGPSILSPDVTRSALMLQV